MIYSCFSGSIVQNLNYGERSNYVCMFTYLNTCANMLFKIKVTFSSRSHSPVFVFVFTVCVHIRSVFTVNAVSILSSFFFALVYSNLCAACYTALILVHHNPDTDRCFEHIVNARDGLSNLKTYNYSFGTVVVAYDSGLRGMSLRCIAVCKFQINHSLIKRKCVLHNKFECPLQS